MKSRPDAPSRFTNDYGLKPSRTWQQLTRTRRLSWRIAAVVAAVVLITTGTAAAMMVHTSVTHTAVTPMTVKPVSHVKKSAPVAAAAVAPPPASLAPQPLPTQPASPATDCHDNTLSQLVIVSIAQRHLWACNLTTPVYNSPVVTGMEFIAADLTPTGTFHVYAKSTDQTLKGCDSTGCWDDPVSYWMPWLSNQYGIYGFHDATWRADSDFGNIDPNSADASHGCIELPLATAAWLYNWAPIGQTLTVES